MTHAEKLILIMLSEIYEHLGIGGADHINARFVRSAIDSNQTWALSRNIPSFFGGRTQTPDVVSEVRDILYMWSFIEEAHERFSAEEKKRVKAEARPYGDARFVGFDRHTDILHIEVAKFLIEGLDHSSRFKGRDLDSHVPVLNAYLRMYQVFEPIRKTLVGRGLTATEMIDILKAPDAETVGTLPDFPDVPPSQVN